MVRQTAIAQSLRSLWERPRSQSTRSSSRGISSYGDALMRGPFDPPARRRQDARGLPRCAKSCKKLTRAQLRQRHSYYGELMMNLKRLCCGFSEQTIASEERAETFRYSRTNQRTIAQPVPAARHRRVRFDAELMKKRHQWQRHVGVKQPHAPSRATPMRLS